MSVINQVLKDLDKRQHSAQGARVRSHYQPANGRPWIWVASLGGGILVSAVVTWWLVAYAFTPNESISANLGENPGDSSFNAGQPETLQAPIDVVAPSTDDDNYAGTEQPQTAMTEPTAVPVAAEQVAQIDPQASASAGNSTTEVVVNSSNEQTPATRPGNENSDVSDMQNDGTAPVTGVAIPAQQGETTHSGNGEQPGNDEQPGDTQSTNRAEQAEEPRGEMSVQRVERSASELATQRLDQAVDAMESGEGRKAESLLQEALVLAPQFVDARERLAAYYYGRGFTSEALRVLREGLAHTPENSRLLTLSARIYEESGRADEALEMLNRIDANLPQQNDLVVLRAALANELGQYQIAADDYRQLLGVNPNQGIWWLGLGVAEEGRADYQAARLAYQRAVEASGLDRASREYARSREEALATW